MPPQLAARSYRREAEHVMSVSRSRNVVRPVVSPSGAAVEPDETVPVLSVSADHRR
jgi:hypothetical protein